MGSTTRDTRPPVVVVTGPTSAGKTTLAIELALRFDGEIVNADSMQIYRYMDIGTAKPTLEQRARVPHHLLDVVTPDVLYDAGRYAQEARAAARTLHERGKAVFLTGGTGLYIRAFLEGLLEAGGANPELRQTLEQEHSRALEAGHATLLYERLAARDPEAAQAIHPRDVRRIVRALEICERGGAVASALRRAHGFGDRPYRSLHLAIDPGREALDVRIDAHCRQKIDAGLLQEVRGLRKRGYGAELRPMQAIGYRHMQPVVDGSDTLANALELMQRDTRRFARRQRTWLRKVPEALPLHPDERGPIYEKVEAFLGGEVARQSM
ncbi:MAG: tRNA (adenosine(37)-N6)-dimethylallyltransferase MiaA [Deltaproteobacteria bacterium]|nr:tRNA (adenosine(37)-N6)-dimethylallyltransferase MiaA [Deltaproteobacteria bacterium]